MGKHASATPFDPLRRAHQFIATDQAHAKGTQATPFDDDARIRGRC